MALKVEIDTTPVGLGIQEAYVRVMQYQGNKQVIVCKVAVYASEAARRAGASPVFTEDVKFDYSETTHILAYCYTQLKALPRFKDAIDA
jgi:hypothetical protein